MKKEVNKTLDSLLEQSTSGKRPDWFIEISEKEFLSAIESPEVEDYTLNIGPNGDDRWEHRFKYNGILYVVSSEDSLPVSAPFMPVSAPFILLRNQQYKPV
jgi:hypothetical protein